MSKGTGRKPTHPNQLKRIMSDNNLKIQDLLSGWRIGGATVNGILNYNLYPEDRTRQGLIDALNEATHKTFTEQDVWPELDNSPIAA